jgi:glycosyltransferase involved in cell wall biosynthesis
MSTGRGEKPLVSVGVPVFNEEEHLATALDSLLAQDYERLEVIVCDNGSDDATPEIAVDYARRDARVTLHRSNGNQGSVANFNRCFELASGPYFTWASGHDARLPTAIRRCVEVLEDDPRVVLCYPRSVWKYADGTSAPVEHETAETRGLPPSLRLKETIERISIGNAVYGVFRSSALARTRLARHCHGADVVLLAELSLLGDFHQLDEVLFFRTQNREPEEWEQAVRRTYDMLPIKSRFGRSRPHTTMVLQQAAGAWHVSTGTEKVSNAWRAASYSRRHWHSHLKREWHLTKPLAKLHGASRRIRAAARVLSSESRG